MDCIAVVQCYDVETCGGAMGISCEVTPDETPATCTADGKTVYTATITFKDENDAVIAGPFSDTQEVIIPATGHTLDYEKANFSWDETDYTCTVTVPCTVCHEDIEVECTVEYEVTTEPTTEATGTGTYTATIYDGEGTPHTSTKTVEIPMLEETHEHTWAITNIVFYWDLDADEPTCIAIIYCDDYDECGTSYAVYVEVDEDAVVPEEEEDANVNVIAVTVVEPTCTEDGTIIYTAIVQFKDENGNVIEFTVEDDDETYTVALEGLEFAGDPATGHDWGEWVETSRDDDNIYYQRECSVCHEKETKTEAIAHTHNWDFENTHFFWDYDNERCIVIVDCTDCDEYMATAAPFDDDAEEGTVNVVTYKEVEPTCTEPGYGVETVWVQFYDENGEPIEFVIDGETHTKIGESLYTETLPALGHDWGEWVETSRDDENIYYQRVCSRCGEIDTMSEPITTEPGNESGTDNEGLSDDTKQELEDAIDHAKEVLDDPDSTQEDIDKALDDLQDAIDKAQHGNDDTQSGSGEGGEGETPTTPSTEGGEGETPSGEIETTTPTTPEDLTQAADDAQSALDAATEAGVDESLIKDLEDAIANAEAVLADENATQADIDAAMEALQAALDAVNDAMNAAGTSTSTATATELVEVEVVDPETGEHYIVYLDPETGIYYADAEGTEVVDEESFILAEDYDEGEDEEDEDEEDEDDEDEEEAEENEVKANTSSTSPNTGASLAALATTMALAAAGAVVVTRKKKEDEE